MIDLRFNIEQVRDLRKQLDTKKVDLALRNAVSTTTRQVRTYISRDIRNVYALKARDINERVSLRRLDRGMTQVLVYTGSRLPLFKFSPTQRTVRVTATSKRGKKFSTRRKQTRVVMKKAQGRQVVERGWLAKNHIMARATEANDAAPVVRFGPSIPGMVAHKSTLDGANKIVKDVLPREFSRRLESLMEKG
ncbi:hypothetical protein [Carnimonas bestiolae]|uniref:hypothetical protein n=1 Tax=Carnimonas bestiolae TaxID=3402172 RepID=UPI003EDCA2BA